MGICYFVVCMTIICGVAFYAGGLAQEKKETPMPEAVSEAATEIQEEATAESMMLQKKEGFLILEKEHRLVVYDSYAEELLFETNILYRDLPEAVQKAADLGIYLANEQELFDFLESYSS
jgi:hypothetical protein